MIPEFNWCYSERLTTNKWLEINLIHWEPTSWFDSKVRWDFKGDHCGPEFSLEIYGFHFSIKIYDARHWNWKQERFYLPGEEWDELAKMEEAMGDQNFCGGIINHIVKK